MPKKPKTDDNIDRTAPDNTHSASNAWIKNKRILLLAGLLLLVLISVGVYLLLSQDKAGDQPNGTEPEDTASLASALEDVEFDESLTQQEIDAHNLSVAAAFMAEGNLDKALEYYLAAENADVATARLFADVAEIYESKDDAVKRDEYLHKYISFLETEIEELEDELAKVGNHTVIGNTYEKVGDSEAAIASFKRALDILNQVTSDSQNEDSIQESRQYLEGKLSES